MFKYYLNKALFEHEIKDNSIFESFLYFFYKKTYNIIITILFIMHTHRTLFIYPKLSYKSLDTAIAVYHVSSYTYLQLEYNNNYLHR